MSNPVLLPCLAPLATFSTSERDIYTFNWHSIQKMYQACDLQEIFSVSKHLGEMTLQSFVIFCILKKLQFNYPLLKKEVLIQN